MLRVFRVKLDLRVFKVLRVSKAHRVFKVLRVLPEDQPTQ